MHDALFAVKTVCLHADSARQNANFWNPIWYEKLGSLSYWNETVSDERRGLNTALT